ETELGIFSAPNSSSADQIAEECHQPPLVLGGCSDSRLDVRRAVHHPLAGVGARLSCGCHELAMMLNVHAAVGSALHADQVPGVGEWRLQPRARRTRLIGKPNQRTRAAHRNADQANAFGRESSLVL